jgi:transcriptional regulator with GAF, ATPase, and Fis domain
MARMLGAITTDLYRERLREDVMMHVLEDKLVEVCVSDRPIHKLIGDSDAMRQLRADIHDAARSHVKVLVLGETGVGKEVVAHQLHDHGPRKHARFVSINCSGVPDTLLESELFGHLRGSFTGAFRDKPGLAKAADRGTLFLDEVGEMSLQMQAAVLRFVETGEIQPVGGTTYGRTDVRFIAATNRDLRERIAQREFREDLFYRLNVVHIRVPPLRDRGDDINLLLHHYLQVFSQMHGVPRPAINADAGRRLRAYRWPGNVRELKNVAERLTARLRGALIREGDLPEEIRADEVAALSTETHVAAASGVLAPVDDAWTRMMNGESFWTVVHARFKSHDLTRADLRALVQRGLSRSQGSYRELVTLFGMAPSDYRRFLAFLSQFDCNLPFQPHRTAKAEIKAPRNEDDTVA